MNSSFFPSYKIIHVHLEAQLMSPPLAPTEQGNYLVFWWKDIALGNLFIEPHQKFTESDYHQALLSVIQPTIRHYAAKTAARSEPWATWLLQGDVTRWHMWMQTVFSAWLPEIIPVQVPVSVIICTRNRATQLRRCLQQIRALRCRPTEIVVVDNASTDTSIEEVVRDFVEAVYVREPRAGLDFARNTGIIAAQNAVVAFVDDDVVVDSMLLYRVWETFEEPTTAAMTGLVIAHSLKTEAQLIFEKHWSFNRGYIDKYYTSEYLNQAAPRVWEIGAGANMAFRKSIFEKIGYFDELLGAGAAGCSDDSEMWHRILCHGYTIHYNPRAIAHHAHREQLTDLKRQLFFYMRGHVVAAFIQHKHRPQDGYNRHLWGMSIYYARLLKNGFPFFRFRHRTLWAEIRGLASGVVYYYNNRGSKSLQK